MSRIRYKQYRPATPKRDATGKFTKARPDHNDYGSMPWDDDADGNLLPSATPSWRCPVHGTRDVRTTNFLTVNGHYSGCYVGDCTEYER